MVLVGKIVQRLYLHRLSLRIVGEHLLLVALAVALDKALGAADDFDGAAKVFLHLQHLCLRVQRRKCQQIFRAGSAKAVDALVLVPDQKQVLLLLHQQPDHRILQPGGVLRLVDAQVAVALAVLLQNRRIAL